MKFQLLEPLRGLAAVWVLLFHYEFSHSFQTAAPGLHAFCKLGELAVPMFFVISGYCIAAAARNSIKKDEPAIRFLTRRLRRIFPPYWASIAVVAALPFLIEFIASLKSGHYVAPSPEKLNYGFLKYDIVDWFQVVTLTRVFADVPGLEELHFKFTTINAVYWSLAIELQFYFVAALGVLLRRHFYPFIVAVTLVSIPCALHANADIWGICLPFWPMFAVGIALYWLFENGYALSQSFRSAAPTISTLVLSSLAFAGVFAVQARVPISHFGFALVFGIAAYFAEGLDAGFGRLLASGPIAVRHVGQGLMLLGTMSYSIYLVHGRVQFLAMQFVRQVVATETIVFDVVSLGATLALCYPFYRYCEKPFISTAPAKPVLKVEQQAAVVA